MSLAKKIILGFVFVFVGTFTYLWIELSSAANKHFVNSKAFEMTVLHIISDSMLYEKSGEIIEIDSSVAGHLYDKESARLVFDIRTNKENITVAAELSYDKGGWIINSVEYK